MWYSSYYCCLHFDKGNKKCKNWICTFRFLFQSHTLAHLKLHFWPHWPNQINGNSMDMLVSEWCLNASGIYINYNSVKTSLCRCHIWLSETKQLCVGSALPERTSSIDYGTEGGVFLRRYIAGCICFVCTIEALLLCGYISASRPPPQQSWLHTMVVQLHNNLYHS